MRCTAAVLCAGEIQRMPRTAAPAGRPPPFTPAEQRRIVRCRQAAPPRPDQPRRTRSRLTARPAHDRIGPDRNDDVRRRFNEKICDRHALRASDPVAALSGCASREAAPVPEEEPASQSEPEEPASEPEEPEPQSSEPDEQEPEYPLPELTDADMKLINQSLSQFLNYFGGTESLSSTSELDPDRVLFFCQMEAFRMKDLLGYFFDQDDKGNYLIPDTVIDDMAQRLFGIEGFSFTDSPRYDPDMQTYGYTLGYEGELQNFATSEPKGAPDGGIAYDVDFFEEGDTSFLSPVRASLFTFRVNRLNGMPFLQLVSIEAK